MSRKPKDEANTSDVSASSRPSGWQPIDHKPLIKRLKAAKKWAQLQAMELGLVRIQGKTCRECEARDGHPHAETCPALHAQRHANTIQDAIRALSLPPGSDPPAPALSLRGRIEALRDEIVTEMDPTRLSQVVDY